VRAGDLAAAVVDADLVVLHVSPSDPIPLLALHDRDRRPPTIFVDHADHVFWLGVGAADVFAHTRSAAARVAQEHRGIASDRSVVLPMPVEEPVTGAEARAEARAESRECLEMAPDSIVLLTVASEYKYAAARGNHLLDILAPVLGHDERVHVVAVGPRPIGLWAQASRQWGGRVRALGTQLDLGQLLLAADIYVDAHPLPSFTTMLEAANAGLPCVGRALGQRGLGYLELDDPALAGAIRVAGAADFAMAVCALVDDPEAREVLGTRLASQVAAGNRGNGWLAAIERTYAAALQTHQAAPPSGEPPAPLPDALAFALSEFHRRGEVDAAIVSVLAKAIVRATPSRALDSAGLVWRLRHDHSTVARGAIAGVCRAE
jgi:hypothetical protein